MDDAVPRACTTAALAAGREARTLVHAMDPRDRLLTNRHDGGAFDVLRQYANLSALGRMLFGWREPPVWIESQGGAFLVVNENVPNLIPDEISRRVLALVAAAHARAGVSP